MFRESTPQFATIPTLSLMSIATKTRNLGMVLVLAILASFAGILPSATAATVSSVFPESGPNTGGTSVTVTGEGFGLSGTPTVTVGGAAATSITRTSDTELTFVTPAGEGISDIVITPTTGTPVTVEGGFTFDSYLITPVIETIHPSSVGQTGGELITITGRYLNYVSSLTVGDSYNISWEYFVSRDSADGRYLSFLNPYSSTPGAKDIKFYGGDQTVTEFAGLTYVAPAITKITPNTGSTTGTTAVVIDGVGFSSLGTLTVSVGGVAATGVTRVSPTQIKATFPANTEGLKDVVVTLYNAGTAPTVFPITKTGAFLYMAASSAPTLTAVIPAKGPAAGGNTATVYGTNLRGTDGNPATITFDGIPATDVVVSVDRKSATVTVPAHASGAVTVAVQTTNGSAAKPSAYTYAVAPTITSITPNTGVTQGGTFISIVGTNFGAGSPTVTVGGQQALCTKLVSPTLIEAVTPAGSLGAANVVVDPGTGVGSATATGGFTYQTAATTPAISSISPNTGLVSGGTTITITTSAAFPTGTPTVVIGGICATNVTRVSSTVVTAVTPVGTAGAKDVSVTFATAHSVATGGFTYAAAPAITSISPARGGITGGTAITINGVGFGNSGTPTVTIGGVAATSIVRVNDTQITAVTPANSAGAKAVVVTPSAGSAITKASGFTYDLPTITSIVPNSGSTKGGNRVIIDGTGFGESGTPVVSFGGRAATDVVRVSSTRLYATTPLGVAGNPTVLVTPTTGTGSASSTTHFTYLAQRITPVITSQSPSWVSAAGGTRVYITGANFRSPDGTPATIEVDGVVMTGVVVSADGTSLSFLSTAMSSGWHTAAVRTTEGIATHVGMRVANPASFDGGGGNICYAVSPWSWNPAGGTAVTVTGSDFGASAGFPTVLVDGVEAEVTDFSDSSVQFTDPGGPLGYADITITFANANEASFTDCVYRHGNMSITANDQSINYGDPTPTFTRTVTGLLGSDSLTGLTYTFVGTDGTSYGPSTTAPTAAGVYRIIPSDGVISPGLISNYDVYYYEGTFVIEGIPATVTAADKSKIYGAATPTFTSTATGLVPGHSVTEVTYIFEGIDGTYYPASSTVPTAAGTYSVTPSDAVVTDGAQVNYSFTYVSGTYTITPRPITVTADDKSREYGESDPDLTYTVTTGSLVDGDVLVGWLSRDGGNDVGTYAINVGTIDAYNPNYSITFVSGDFVITAKSITVTAEDQIKGYGESDPELTYSSSGLIGGDQLSGSLSRVAGEAVGTYTISQGSLTGGSNYILTGFTSGTLEITPRSLQLTVDNQSVEYGQPRPANSFSITDGGLATGDVISSLTYTYSTSSFDVGYHEIAGATPVFGSGSASNYSIEIVSGVLEVTPKPITVTADDLEKTYGDDDPTLTYVLSEPLIGSDTLSGSLSRDAGEGVGEYSITIGSLSAGGNYDLTVNGAVFTINPRPITLTADAKTKVYGDDEPAGSWQVTAGDMVVGDVLVGWLGREDGNDVGTYAYNIGVLGLYNPSYDITFVSADLTIEPREISVTIDDVSKDYGDDDPTFTYSSSGLLEGDSLTGSASRAAGEGVGEYTISSGNLGGGSNYILTGITAGTLTINARPLDIYIASTSVEYGDTLPTNSIESVNGLVNGETVTSLTYGYSATPTNVGEYSITGSDPVFGSGSASNYTITIWSGTLYVSQRPVSLTAVDDSKQYGSTDPSFTYTIDAGSSFVNGDLPTGSPTRDEGEGVGEYTIGIGSLDAGSNYSLQFTNGTFTIDPRPITVTADAKQKTYGDEDPTATWQVSGAGLAFSDALVGWMGRDPGEDAGTYAYSIGVLGEYNPNYDITFVSANLTIDPKTISVTLDNQTKTYGDSDPTFTYTSAGLLDGDTLSGEPTRDAGEDVGTYNINAGTLSGGSNYTVSGITPATLTIGTRPITIQANDQSMNYGDSVPTNGFQLASGSYGFTDDISSVSYTYSNTVGDAGGYLITPSNPVFSVGSASNYDITYTDGTLTVNAIDITLQVSDEVITYGDPEPTWTVNTVGNSFVGSDGYTGTPERDPGADAGTYAIRQGSVSVSSNYNLTFVDGTLTINQLPITVEADPLNKIYGQDDPALTWILPGIQLVGSDQFTGSLERSAGEDAGSYTINQGTLDNSNYDITFVTNSLTIEPKDINVYTNGAVKTYGDEDPTFTFASNDLVGDDTLGGSASRAPGEDVGFYAISAAGVTAGPNYNITSTNEGHLEIQPRPITVTMSDAERAYGQSDPLSWSWTETGGIVGADQPTGDGTRVAGEDAGTYSISEGSLNFGSNYSVTFNPGLLTITPVDIEITADNVSKMYGDSDPSLTYAHTGGDFVGGDGLSGSLDREAGDTPGEYAITVGSLSAGSNYNVTVVGGTLTITNRPVTVDPDSTSKIYGDGDPEFTYSVSGLAMINGDTLTGSLGRAAGEDVGTYAIELGELSHPYHDITVSSATLTIDPRDITVYTVGTEKFYGNPDPDFDFGSDELVFGDTLGGTVTRIAGEDVGTYTLSAAEITASSNYTIIGVSEGEFNIQPRPVTITMANAQKEYSTADPDSFTYSITDGDLVVGDVVTGAPTRAAGESIGEYLIGGGDIDFGPNYDVSYIDGTFTIVPIAIELTANDVEKEYGSDDPELTYSFSSGDLADGDTLTGTLAREAGEDVGTYAITPGSLSAGPNYEVTILSGTLTVTPKPITVTADDKSKTYGDGDPTLTWSANPGDLEDSDTLAGALSRTAGEDVGSYDITVGDLANSNYAITFVNGTLDIDPKGIAVVVTDTSKQYGDDDPVFEYTVDGQSGVSLGGELSRTAGNNVGTYTINQGTLVGGSNYIIDSFTPGSLEITARNLEITITDDTMIFGDAVPSAQYTVGGDGMGYSDQVGSITVDYPIAVNGVGEYAVDGATVTLSSGNLDNYEISVNSGTLTVEPKPATVTLNDLAGEWGAALNTPTWTTGDLEGSDAIDTMDFTFDGSSTEPTLPGEYVLDGANVALSTGDAANYIFTVVPATLTISGPEFLAIDPPEGFVTGGFPFTITGSGFGTETPTVQFDGLDATDVTLVDSSTITGFTPEHVEGPVTVTVITTEETLEMPEVYTYIPIPPAPEVFTMFPPEGPTAGGTLVTFSGANLFNSDGTPGAVTFDGVDGTAEAISEDGVTLTVRTPEHVVETVDVVITTDGGILTLPASFSFFEGPVGDLGGKLWIDSNFDAQYQESESVLPNTQLAIVREGALDPELPSGIMPLNRVAAAYRASVGLPERVIAPITTYYWVGATDANGRYEIPQLPYGNYVLVYTLPEDFQETVGGGTPGAVSIVLSTPQLEQDLAGAGSSELIQNQVVLKSTGEPVAYCETRLRWSGSDNELNTEDDVLFPVLCDENGQFTIEGLVSGSYDVETYDEDPLVAIPKPVDLDAFATQDGGIWQLIPRGSDAGELASTGFNVYSLASTGFGLIVIAIIAMGSRRKQRR